MLDKICSFLLLPLYASWRFLLGCDFERKKVQYSLVRPIYFLTIIAFSFFFLDSSNIVLKIFFGFILTALLMTSFKSTENKVEDMLKKNELAFITNKWLRYKKSILLIITSSSLSFVFDYAPLLISTLCQFLVLFILVGFEFPDEPPKKEKELQKNGSWLANLLPPKPVTNV